MEYVLSDKPCPKCGNAIKFADFCPSCNIKYCPKCKATNNPYARTCICGCKFPNLEEEYFLWTGKREIEFIDGSLNND